MKETNMEHFRSEIEKVGHDFAFINGKVEKCKMCKKCDFETEPDEAWESCTIRKMRWLMSEYKPEPVLTAREKHFVEFAQEGWLARDGDGELWWYKLKPEKKKESWSVGSVTYSFKGILNFEQHFRFITWEDEEPWSVEELRKLKVKAGDQDA